MAKRFQRSILGLFLLTTAVMTIASDSQAKTVCEAGIHAYLKKHVHGTSTHFALATTGGRSLKAAGTDCDVRLGATQAISKASAIKECAKASRKHHHFEGCKVIQSQ